MQYLKRIAPKAHRDIAEIKDYISMDKPNAAIKMAKEIYASFDSLQANPFIGAELTKKFGIEMDYMCLLASPYIVFYKVEDNYVGIYRVLDARSDYLKKLGFKNKNIANKEN